MALPANHPSFLFLLVLIFSTQIQARESKFFNKFNHYQQLNTTINGTANIATTTTTTTGNGNTMNTTANTSTTTTTTTPNSEGLKETELPQEQVPSGKQVEEENSHGYGLYGSNQNPPTTAKTSQEYTYANTPNKASTEEYTGGGYEEEATTGYENDNNNNYGYKPKQFGMSDTRFMDNANVYNNNNNGYSDNQYETGFQENGSNGAKTKQMGVSDTSFLDNNDVNNNKGFGDKQYSSSYTGVQENDNNGFETKEFSPSDSKFLDNDNINNDNGYETKQYKTSANKNGDNLSGVKQQGASDTRFMENGKYFYNVNNENSYLNDYQLESRSYGGFSSSQRVDARNNNNHGNNENAYEFNNSMEESQYQDEENQEEFLP